MQGLKFRCYFAESLGCLRITLDVNIQGPDREGSYHAKLDGECLLWEASYRTMDGKVPVWLLNPTKVMINLQAGVCCAEANAALSTQQNIDRSGQDSNCSLPSYFSELFERSSGHLTTEQAAALKSTDTDVSGEDIGVLVSQNNDGKDRKTSSLR
ncbi:hypothetical protein CHS0354_037732 [Potamilus streckersoni]|uniref:Uncharacterized protein n=1 Tax=Potamilus streckersoni TaxID=2493646 RepID=A0AAE0T0K0_9BIVA|nr:hypothetical protein CHS0354_037732 [Potamilus streckersoni]